MCSDGFGVRYCRYCNGMGEKPMTTLPLTLRNTKLHASVNRCQHRKVGAGIRANDEAAVQFGERPGLRRLPWGRSCLPRHKAAT
jgi:hypothetical protein